MRRISYKVLILVLITGCCGMLLLPSLERLLILHPGPPALQAPPTSLGIEEVWFEAEDGSPLHGWYIAGSECGILMSHGNAGDVSSRGAQLMRVHQETGCSVMMYDYRGYGKSEGSPTVAGVIDDGRKAAHFLADRLGTEPSALIQYGRSLGGGVAAAIADREGAKAVILVNTFSSLVDMGQRRFPFLPAKWLLSDPMDSFSAMRNFDGPLLQAHATNDEVVPYILGQRLHVAAREPKQFVSLWDRTHNEELPDSWYAELRSFVTALP